MANFFVPQRADSSLYAMTMSLEGSGGNTPFLHPWKITLGVNESALIGLSGGWDRNVPLKVTSNQDVVANDPTDASVSIAGADRILKVSAKEPGFTMLEVKKQGNGQPWCWLQVEVIRRPGVKGTITPHGPPEFVRQVLQDIEQLKRSPSFTRMYNAILATGYLITIVPSNAASYTKPLFLQDSFRKPDGTPGRGSGDIIGYDYRARSLGQENANEPWRTSGNPYISLGHEFVHCWMDTGGISTSEFLPNGQIKLNGIKENRAAGTGQFTGEEFSENRFRSELGLLPRPYYYAHSNDKK